MRGDAETGPPEGDPVPLVTSQRRCPFQTGIQLLSAWLERCSDQAAGALVGFPVDW